MQPIYLINTRNLQVFLHPGFWRWYHVYLGTPDTHILSLGWLKVTARHA